MEERPKLNKEITPNDFKDFYWLKEELVSFAGKQELKKDPNYKREIAPQFEYNRFIRDFMNDNPDKKGVKQQNIGKSRSHFVAIMFIEDRIWKDRKSFFN